MVQSPSAVKVIGGGVWGQKYMLSLSARTFHPGHNAFYGIQKSLPVLEIFTAQISKIGPFRGKNRLFCQ